MRFTQICLKTLKDVEFKYFKRWVEREMHGDQVRLDFHPLRGWRERKKTDWHYNEDRPWTQQFKDHQKKNNKRYFVQPIKNHTIFKGDMVEVLVGKDKGKQGYVNCIIKERNWCFVDGLNCEHRMLPSGPGMMPVCMRDERPLLITNQVKLVDPSDNKACDIEWRMLVDEDKEVRVSKRTGRVIPIPLAAEELEDGVVPFQYTSSVKTDTDEKATNEVTFVPKLLTFEEDIMEDMNIVDESQRAKTYWY